MTSLNHIVGYFNLILGVIFILIGFKIYKPFSKEREEMNKKNIDLYKIGGIGLVIWGLVKIL
ncbi:MAG: hypothetical protein JSS79_15515 [Bacteroidetes bacterium]|nr:hypothetical protein [Bacteroidota bacterium]